MNPVNKYSPYRNPKILKAAKDMRCQHCNAPNAVMAHSNLISDGKGVGKKSDDIFVAALCDKCHKEYDLKLMRKYTDANGGEHGERMFTQEDFHRAMKKTWKLILENGVLQ